MDLKILCTQWGHDHLPVEDFFGRVKQAGYDGVDTWMPEGKAERTQFVRLLEQYKLAIVSHQHQAKGNNIKEYCRSLDYYLNLSLECGPLLINSHSGRDYFTMDEQMRVLDTVEKFGNDHNILVAHETHRGRMAFSPGNFAQLLAQKPTLKITADFSHWVCVTESYLDHFQQTLTDAISQTAHTHARVGFPEGPQVPDPFMPGWEDTLAYFTLLWQRIYDAAIRNGQKIFTITPEAGPVPYMWTHPGSGQPLADQWEVNLRMKNHLEKTLPGRNNPATT